MSKPFDKRTLDEHIECYGNFSKTDPICTRLCAVNLRCAIEGDEQDRMEILEDLVASEVMFMKIQ